MVHYLIHFYVYERKIIFENCSNVQLTWTPPDVLFFHISMIARLNASALSWLSHSVFFIVDASKSKYPDAMDFIFGCDMHAPKRIIWFVVNSLLPSAMLLYVDVATSSVTEGNTFQVVWKNLK